MIWNLSNIGTTASITSRRLSYKIYTANFGSHTISVIDYITNSSSTIILPIGCGPQGVALSLDGKKLYVASYNYSVVYVIDTKTNNIIKNINGISYPYNIRTSLNGKIYVLGYNNISVIDTVTDSIITTINAPATWDITFSPFNGLAYASSNSNIYLIDYINDTLYSVFAPGHSALKGIVIDPIDYALHSTHTFCGKVYTCVCAPTNYVLTYTTYNGSDNRAFVLGGTYSNNGVPYGNIGSNPQGIAISPSGNSLYVANYDSNTITIIYPMDFSHNPGQIITGGTNPFGMFATPDGAYVYITNYTSNNVSKLRTSDNNVTNMISVGSIPMFITGGNIPY